MAPLYGAESGQGNYCFDISHGAESVRSVATSIDINTSWHFGHYLNRKCLGTTLRTLPACPLNSPSNTLFAAHRSRATRMTHVRTHPPIVGRWHDPPPPCCASYHCFIGDVWHIQLCLLGRTRSQRHTSVAARTTYRSGT